MNLDRRQFILILGAATVAPGSLLRSTDAPTAWSPVVPSSSGSTPWHQKLRRAGQINFNERDPLELDVNGWADTWSDLKADAVLISVTASSLFTPPLFPTIATAAFSATAISSLNAAPQQKNADPA